MLTIDMVPAQAVRRTVATKVPKLTEYAKRTMKRYADAYKTVYHMLPNITFDGAYFRIHGHTEGVKRTRLLEMAKQLEFRHNA